MSGARLRYRNLCLGALIRAIDRIGFEKDEVVLGFRHWMFSGDSPVM